MEQGKTKRVNRRNKLFGALFVVSLIFIMISVTFSWFTTGKSAQVSGIQMQVEDGDELTLKIGDEQSTSMSFKFDAYYPLQARTGNGLYFYDAVLGYPEGDQEESGSSTIDKVVVGYTHVIDPEIPDPEDPDNPDTMACERYIKNGVCAVDFSMSLDKDSDVFLYGKRSSSVASNIRPADSDAYSDAEQYPFGSSSPYGDFDIGYICGAMRIAILQKNSDGTYESKLIWAPSSTVELYQDEQGQLHVNPNSANCETTYTYLGEDPDEPIVIETNGEASGHQEIDGVVYAWGEIETKLPMGTLTGGEENEFRLVIWVDGNDRECHNALLSGLVFLILHFGL